MLNGAFHLEDKDDRVIFYYILLYQIILYYKLSSFGDVVLWRVYDDHAAVTIRAEQCGK